MRSLKGRRLYLYLLSCLLLFSFSTSASSIQVQIQERAIIKDVLFPVLQEKLQAIDLAKQQGIAKLQQVKNELQKFKNISIYKPLPLLGRSNLYWVAGSIAFTIAVDNLIQKLEEEEEKQVRKVPPSECLCVDYCLFPYGPQDYRGFSFVYSSGYLHIFRGYLIGGNGRCSVYYEYTERVFFNTDLLIVCGRAVDTPPALPPCGDSGSPPSQTQTRSPVPFIIPPNLLDEAVQGVPETTTYNIPLPDTVKSLQDIQNLQPLTDASFPPAVKIDIPHALGDGVLDSSPSTPGNFVPDIATDKISVTYNINDNVYNEYNTVDNSSTSQDTGTYTPADKQLDTNIEKPEKELLTQLISDFLSNNPIAHLFEIKSAPSGQCSFLISHPFGSAVLDFCRFQSVFNMIGSVIIVFAYVYSIYIIFKKE